MERLLGLLRLGWVAIALSACTSTDKPGFSFRPEVGFEKAVSVSVSVAGDGRTRAELGNQSRTDIEWSGTSSSPWYRIRYRSVLGWHEHDVGWFCGVGLGLHRVPRGKSFKFYFEMPESRSRHIQVGVHYRPVDSKNDHIAWSTPHTIPDRPLPKR